MRDLLIKAVEAAKGWQFIPSHQFVKIPGFTEPTSIIRMNTVSKDALVAQLIRQIDESETFAFSQTDSGRAIVTNSKPIKDQPDRSSAHNLDDGRTITALKVIELSGFIK